MMKKLYVLFIPTAIIAVLCTVLLYQLTNDSTAARTIPSLENKKIPTFKLQTLDGKKTYSNHDFSGEIALVNFFASWCTPCKAEHPILLSLAQRGVPIYGINMKDKYADVVSWFAKDGNPYKITLKDDTGRSMVAWGLYGLPETFVIDRNGVIRFRWAGPLTADIVNQNILPLIKRLEKGNK